MIIGVVAGSVIASQKVSNMDGLALRIVRRVTPDGKLTDTYVVAVDALGTDHGEYVLLASGSTARQTVLTDTKPVDAIIIAIVDTWQIKNEVIFEKMSPLDMRSQS